MGIGPIRFGDQVESHLIGFGLVKEDGWQDGSDEWVYYGSRREDLWLLTINGKITSVTCTTCYFNGTNLVGLSERELRALFPGAASKSSDGAFGTTFELHEHGLSADIREGAISRVTVSIDPDRVIEIADN